jgi:transcriptional/translational regulatory protein YebC/TACO1
MFQKAREASVPIDTIERAIKRGTGELEGVRYEAISYEGYGPSGVAVIVETLTRQSKPHERRDQTPLRQEQGGAIAEPGAVAWQFDRKGIVEVEGPSMRISSSSGSWKWAPRTTKRTARTTR